MGVVVAVLMAVFGVLPAGVVGFAIGWHSNDGWRGNDMRHHQRFDRTNDGRREWQNDGRQGDKRWRDNGQLPGQRPNAPGQPPRKQDRNTQPTPSNAPSAPDSTPTA